MGVVGQIVGAALAFATATVVALPVQDDVAGHYLVVRLDADGRPQPVFHRRVALDGDRAIANPGALALAKANPDQLVVEAEGWRTVVDVPRFVRGEFAANGVDGAIDRRIAPNTERAFVVRVPAGVDGELTLSNLGRETSLDLEALERDASALPIADVPDAAMQSAAGSAPGTASGPSSNRVDILVMGDGYTAGEAAKFATDVENMRVAMFGFSPYREYAGFVNWTSLFTASAQSGADHPPYQAGCTSTSCCAETAAQTDPRANTFVDTAFDGRFCTSQIHRLVTVSNSKVLAAASASPNWDEIVVLVNDPVYGGAGGSISVTTTNASARLIVVHEYGHTFHRLADEYTTAYPGFPACSDVSGARACEANVTDETDPARIKWAPWIAPGNAIPTPAGTSGIGLFVGARYQTSGMHRPANNCAMRSLGGQFCSVCSQEYVLRLYRGGWGTPSAGIDLIEPGSESPSTAGTVNVSSGGSQVFSASVLRPSPDSVTLQWYVDGVAVPGANGASFAFQPGSGGPSTRTVELRATDATGLVRAQMAGSDLVHRRTWNISVQTTARPNLSLGDVRIAEGNAGVTTVPLPILLDVPAPPTGLQVNLLTVDDTAMAPADYVSGAVQAFVPAGSRVGSATLTLVGDTNVEANERFLIRVVAAEGADVVDGEGTVTILNDDGDGLPSFGAWPDRLSIPPGTAESTMRVLANDVFDAARLAGGQLSVVRAPRRGAARIADGGAPADASDDAVIYSPTMINGEDDFRYRLCEASGRCVEAEVQVFRRLAADPTRVTGNLDRGYRDVTLVATVAMPGARFEAHGLVAPTLFSMSLGTDVTPQDPFDVENGGTSTSLRTLPAGPTAREWRVLVNSGRFGFGNVDLYLGVDTNANGLAEPSELRCAAAMAGENAEEQCDLSLSQPAGTAVSYWILAQSRRLGALAWIEVAEVPIDRPVAERTLAATAPGRLAPGASFPMRYIWSDFGTGWVEVKSDTGVSLGWVPIRISSDVLNGGASASRRVVPYALASGVTTRAWFGGLAREDGLFIDVPPGMSRLEVDVREGFGYLLVHPSRVDAPVASGDTPTIPRDPALDRPANAAPPVVIQNPAAGRWHITITNGDTGANRGAITATLTGTGPQLRPGGFYNPQRSGNGLFLYPAGNQWAGLWYTYLQDGTTTWYYLQGDAPGATGVWRGTIFRSAWNGSSNFLTPIGEATVTPKSTSAFTYSYTLDGETGSEAYENFGGGCPAFAGAALNASGHWFDPAKAGSGYSVQLFPNYEFYTVFGYDAQGVPRYLVAERSGIGGATEALTLEQNTGACPLCNRTGNPARATVGTLTRTIGSGTLQRIQLSGTFTAGVPGTWSANDAVIPLGSLQGCAAN
jgi:hypothetical protein